MHIRHFTAPTMAEALAEMRAEMGDNALILSSERSRRGTIVRAAAERAPDGETRTNAAIAADPARSFAERMLATLAIADSAENQQAAHPRIGGPDHLANTLAFHGVAPAIAASLVQEAESCSSEGPVIALARALDTRLSFEPIEVAPARPVMLVGLPGAGKSAVAARLAIRAVLSGRQVQLIAAGPDRAGARAQLETYGRLIRTEVLVAEDADALSQLSGTDAAGPLRIIDTAGINPFLPDDRRALARFASAANAEPVLVTPSSCADLEDHVALFAGIGVTRMILSRMDCARRHGAALNAAASVKVAFAHAASSPFIGEAMAPLNPFTLARLLLELPAQPS